MRVYRDHHHRHLLAASTVAIGNFDGVHRGHQALIEKARVIAGELGKDGEPEPAVAVVSFEPLPRAFFDATSAPPRLSGPAEKLRLLRAQGVDLTWLLRFNEALAGLSPRAFVEQVLLEGLGARAVVIGHDFRFGRRRAGDLALMQSLGEELGFTVAPVGDVQAAGERISSTALRDALAAGDFGAAAVMLGRPYSFRGRVVRGQQLGRKLGYPTANLRPWRGSTPLHGVYAVQARVLATPGAAGNGAKSGVAEAAGPAAGPWLDGVASVGTRPVVDGSDTLIEVHLFDFAGDLYGRRLETRFIAGLRGEEDFPDLDALVAQMDKDAENARTALAAVSAGMSPPAVQLPGVGK